MKKYLLGLTALILIIGGSAFITKQHEAKKNVAQYWYEINGSGVSSPSSLINTSGAKTRADMLDEFGDVLPCTNAGGAPCISGFENPLTSPTTDIGIDQITHPQ